MTMNWGWVAGVLCAATCFAETNSAPVWIDRAPLTPQTAVFPIGGGALQQQAARALEGVLAGDRYRAVRAPARRQGRGVLEALPPRHRVGAPGGDGEQQGGDGMDAWHGRFRDQGFRSASADSTRPVASVTVACSW